MQDFLDDVDVLDSRRFLVAARRLADSLSYGTDHSPFLGSGIEFVQSRPYQPGDSVKSIDWRVTARTGKFFVKEYEAPKRLPVYLLVDTSASMTIRSGKRSKYSLAVQVAAGVGLACLDRISPVGVVGTGERDIFVEPSLSKSQILQWFHQLRRFRYDEGTTLRQRILELGASLRQRAMLIVLSDMHEAGVLSPLKRMAQQHDCVVLHFVDPAERGLRGAGFLRAQEAETAFAFVTRGRRRWTDSTSIEAELKRCGVDHLPLDTSQPYLHQLRHFFASRDLLGRGAR